jgi:hypothetical protein
MKGGRLKIVNESRYPDEEVERLVRFGLDQIDVTGAKLLALVRDHPSGDYRGWGGDADDFYDQPTVHAHARKHRAAYVAVMRVGPPERFPIKPFRRNGNLFDYRTWQETLVGITAHEGMHVQHAYDGAYRTRSGTRRPTRWSSGARVRVGAERVEPKCEAFELGTLRRYRSRLRRTPAADVREAGVVLTAVQPGGEVHRAPLTLSTAAAQAAEGAASGLAGVGAAGLHRHES